MKDCTNKNAIGLVSNCFERQLQAGESLGSLLAKARDRGFGCVELRQGSLGEFESALFGRGDPGAFAALSERFPELDLNLAVALPVFASVWKEGAAKEEEAREGAAFQRALLAAQALSGGDPVKSRGPHVRIVDPTNTVISNAAVIEDRLSVLASDMGHLGGRLSIEHAHQAWPSFNALLQGARHRLADPALLSICFDPCNLSLSAGPVPDPDEVLRSVRSDSISMLHAKQKATRTSPVDQRVGPGWVDWSRLAVVVREIGYRGPVLLEIASSDEIWENCEASVCFLEEAGFNFGRA